MFRHFSRRRLNLLTFAICIIVGSLLGAFFHGVFVEHDPSIVLRTDIAGLPVLFYALLSGAPIGAIAAAIAIFLCRRIVTKNWTGLSWLAAGASVGFALGFGYGLIGSLLTADSKSILQVSIRTAFYVTGMPGLICGLLIGFAWWRLSEGEQPATA